MAQFCTSCGKAIAEGSPFCTACGAPQASAAPTATPSPGPIPVAPAPARPRGSPVVKIVLAVVGVIALGMVVVMGSCFFIAYRLRNKAKQFSAALNEVPSSSQPSTAPANGMPDLAGAMSKLGDSIQQPASPMHVSFKKSTSDGFSYALEADVSPNSITGQETDVSPKSGTGSEASGGTAVFPRNATGAGTPEWTSTAGAIELAYLNSTMNGMRDAQAGIKSAGDEQTGGYDARRYDFDLASAPANAKLPTLLAGKWLGAVASGVTGKRVTLKDYNVKGSAWLAKDD
ncbi:MAG TPA: zinc ribbon domain-containing protein, partial [Terriglobia bacterium]|nr:zinc ribbon domain-containing protein [Terriglobia bacterium]